MNKALWNLGTLATLSLAAYGCGSKGTGTTTTAGAGGSTATARTPPARTRPARTRPARAWAAWAWAAWARAASAWAAASPSPSRPCGAPAKAPSNGTCYKGMAGTGGAGGGSDLPCNPFTGVDCDLAGGESCDFDGVQFSCFPPDNTAKLCGSCGVDSPDGGAAQFCSLGLTCLDSNKCGAFCCNDGDCGAGGKCDKNFLGDPDVGVCLM